MYKLLICIIICRFIKNLFKFKINNDVIPDIVIAPGGKYGFYIMGICHYIRNNFDTTNKKIVGFSAGAWCSIILTMKKEQINDILKKFFYIKNNKINLMLDEIEKIVSCCNFNDMNVKNIYVAILNANKKTLGFHSNFISTDHFVRCCKTSSFIPMITSKKILSFYNSDISFDGGLLFKKYKKELIHKPLIISYKMFGRYNNGNAINSFVKELTNSKMSIYEYYMNGYKDASLNHKYFQDYLVSSS